MGRRAREKPERLAEKLRQIRLTLGLSQTEMLKRLEAEDMVEYNRISDYEVGTSEPTLIILLRYARLAGVHMEALVDDELNLPEKLPDTVKHEEIRRKYIPASRSKRR
jgi:transcriptional regulator with XRE-family HTH domain